MKRLEASPGSPPLPRASRRCIRKRTPFDKPKGSWAMVIGKPGTYTVEPLSDQVPQMKPAEKPSQQPQEPPTVVPERASAQ
jgi:hypothetical protein